MTRKYCVILEFPYFGDLCYNLHMKYRERKPKRGVKGYGENRTEIPVCK